VPLTAPELDPAAVRPDISCKAEEPGDQGLMDQLICRAPEMAFLRRLGAGLLRVGGNMAGQAAHLAAVLTADGDLKDRTLLLLNNAPPNRQDVFRTAEEAIARCGPAHVRAVAAAAAVSEVISGTEGPSRCAYQIGRHSIWVALCSKLIAERCELPHAHLTFVAGLLHDIGLLIEARHASAAFTGIIGMKCTDQVMPAAERAQLGFDHCELGARICQECGFPGPVQSAVAFHHRASDSLAEDRCIVECVEVANVVCSLTGAASVPGLALKPPIGAMGNLGLGKTDLRSLSSELERQVTVFETILIRHQSRHDPRWTRSDEEVDLFQG